MTTIEYEDETLVVFETGDKLKLLKWPTPDDICDEWYKPSFKPMSRHAAVQVEVVGYSLKRRQVKIELSTKLRLTVDHYWLLRNSDLISL
jgi:hypothetical protein